MMLLLQRRHLALCKEFLKGGLEIAQPRDTVQVAAALGL